MWFLQTIYVLAAEAVGRFFAFGRECGDARLVGVCRNAVVGNATRNPNCTFVAHAFANHFQNPNLLRIGYRKRFSAAAVTVLRHKVGHRANGFARIFRSLQGDVNQATVVYQSRGVDQLLATAVSGLANGQLMFVHVAHYVVGLRGFGNLAKIFSCVPIVHWTHGAFGVRGSRVVVERAKQRIRVGRVGYHGRAVDGCVFAHQKICASPAHACAGCK